MSLLLIALLVFNLLAIPVAYLFLNEDFQRHEDEERNSLYAILSLSILQPIQNNDLPLLQKIVDQSMAGMADLHRVKIEDTNRQILLDQIHEEETAHDGMSLYRQPIMSQGKLYGYLTLEWEHEVFSHGMADMLKIVHWYISGALVIFAGLIFILLHFLMLRPLNKINQGLKMLTRGRKLSRSNPVYANRELQTLMETTDQLSGMLASEKKREAQLRESRHQFEDEMIISIDKFERALNDPKLTRPDKDQLIEELRQEQQRSQEKLLQTEKMASLGVLSAGIAHEINNPLSFVKSNLQRVKGYHQLLLQLANFCYRHRYDPKLELLHQKLQELEEGDLQFIMQDISPLMEESLEGVERMQEIVEGLYNFARADKGEVELLDINQLLESTLKIVWSELKDHCEITREFTELPKVQGNTGKLKQVFLNFLMNASQAIESEGVIAIRTYCDGDDAVIEVEDNGHGMSVEQQHQLFTPFYTTKPVGKGMGLGLSVSLGIIEEHDGSIEVKSEPEQGSLFKVRLPLTPECAAD
ncbi:sensor histidine kinase [Dongshaea marina]|uniref:sensor histidine kinase n=1 Tax=Dongshaea marina TaxID=2047966 RepID=UPI00131F01A0|nr:ATP-binding protein [Dongshaea marina]